ncbi:hypothetical protein A1O7_08879 [Cladophialophora yegresii CBS 114405]|uniref:BOD1/SHG1 domain-containing protein n=1 Tax=Cladophialophora yegresii CBS 114405 TaxID=1182544 RepID=W9VKC4_9EURO|nr:uncharacterized protein A1O7_08879 [Cladophialophora yegresii CBS 114405]EXJ55948.1 hypothetical protein A1O7_08879 [Cladophialophora yegresii CBS 114405]
MVDAMMTDAPAIDSDAPFSLRPRFKISDLPLVKEQRSTIDALLLKFKKQGGYDSLRKQVWASYNTSDAKTALTDQIHTIAEQEIEKDSKLLSRERGKAATLIQGAVERSGIYADVESRIDVEIAKHLSTVLDAVRDIRRGDVGVEVAAEEEQRGGKSDEQYSQETQNRAAERERNRSRMEQLLRETAELKAKIKAQEEKKRKEEEAKWEEEERKKREAEAEERRIAREKRRKEEEEKEAERVKARDERHRKREEERRERHARYERERDRERDRDRDRDRDHGRDRDREVERDRSRDRDRERERRRSTDRRGSITESAAATTTTKDVAQADEKDLEATALELLLSEGKKMAAKAKERPAYDFEKSELHNNLETATDAEADLGNPDRLFKKGRKTGPVIGGPLSFKKKRKLGPAIGGLLLSKKRRRSSLIRLTPEAQAETVKRARHAVDRLLHRQPRKSERLGTLGRGGLGPHHHWASTDTFLAEGLIGRRKSASVIDRGVICETLKRTHAENTTVTGVIGRPVNVIKIGTVRRIEPRLIVIGTGTGIETAIEALVTGRAVETEAVNGTGLGTVTGTGRDTGSNSEIVATATAIENAIVTEVETEIARERGHRLEIEIGIVTVTVTATASETGEIEAAGAMTEGTTDEMTEEMTGRTTVVMIEELTGKMIVMMTEETTGKMTGVIVMIAVTVMTADESATELATLVETATATATLSKSTDMSQDVKEGFPPNRWHVVAGIYTEIRSTSSHGQCAYRSRSTHCR